MWQASIEFGYNKKGNKHFLNLGRGKTLVFLAWRMQQ